MSTFSQSPRKMTIKIILAKKFLIYNKYISKEYLFKTEITFIVSSN